MKKSLILNYHNISEDSEKDKLYTISPSIFKLHLNLIKDLKIPVVRMEHVLQNKLSEDFSVVFSFDDGYASNLTEVLPVLEKYKYPATFFPIVDFIGKDNRLTWEEIKHMSQKDFEFGSHGITHSSFTKLDLTEIQKELKESKFLIEQQIDRPVKYFALPYGKYNTKIIELAKDFDYKLVLTTGLKSNVVHSNSFLLYRWNITNQLSIETFKSIMQTKGNLPVRIKSIFFAKRIVKAILGDKLTEKLNRKYSRG